MNGMEVIFAAVREGWADLCRVVTAYHLPKRVSMEQALGSAEDLAAVTRSPSDGRRLADETGFAGDILVGVLPGSVSGRSPVSAEREVMDSGFAPVALWPVMFTRPESILTHRVLRGGYLAIEGKRALPCEFAGSGSVMPDASEFRRSFRGAERSLNENRRLAEGLARRPSVMERERVRIPAEEERLAEVVRTRVREVYEDSPCASSRAEKELEVILENGLAGYFLSFEEIVDHCRKRGIAVSARGSAAGSVVAYLLGISIVCPIRHGLSFSRFFNTLRSDLPDIDLDIDSAMREQVVEWFLGRAGRRGAAVSRTVTHRQRSAFRVAASAVGMGRDETDVLSGSVCRPGSAVWRERAAARALNESLLLRGIPSHLAPHPCGLVLTRGPVESMVPLHPSPSGLPVTHFDKDGIEAMGLMKMDLLGQRGLTAVSTACLRLGGDPMRVFRRGGDIQTGARELLAAGMTIGVTHVESPAMRCLLKEMKVRTMEDVARALALVRPGAAAGGGRRRYLERMRTGKAEDEDLPELRGLFADSLGVMLYQEDVSRAAEAFLGLEEASADLLRRRMASKQVAEEEIVAECRRRGMSPAKAAAVWEILSGYAGYGFCRAHAFTYGSEACGAAMLKAEHPAVYMASVMAAGGGFYGARVYLEEARRLGIRFLPPGVNTGEWLTCERGGAIVPGFRHLRGMGSGEYRKLKEGRPYRFPIDVRSAGLGPSLCRSMAAAGCFRELGFSPPEALLELEAGDGGFLGDMRPDTPSLPDYSMRTRVAMEMGLLGLPLGASPMELITRPAGTVPLSEHASRRGIRIWGRPVTARRLKAGAGFMMLEDDTGVADVFLASPLFGRTERVLVRPEATVIVRGVVENGSRIRALAAEPGPLLPEPLEPEPPEKQCRQTREGQSRWP